MKKKIAYLAASFMILFVSGCTKPVSTVPSETDSSKQALSQEATTFPPPSFKIEGLNNGDILATGDLKLKLLLSNFTLVDANSTAAPKSTEGHIHYWLDSDVAKASAAVQVFKDPENIVVKGLKPGEHSITFSLVDSEHKPIPGATTESISFTIKQPSAAASAKPSPTPKTSPKPANANAEVETKEKDTIADSKTSFQLIGIKNGDIITTEDLKFKVAITGLNLVNYNKEPDPKDGDGHIHIWLDTTSTDPKNAIKLYVDPDHVIIKHIKEGQHTMTIGLVSNDHKTIIGPTQTVKFYVKH